MKTEKKSSNSWLNIANLLSILRLLILPIFLWLAHSYSIDPKESYLAYLLLLVLFGALTDFFDGYLARRLKQETKLGRFLDPACDKIVGISIFSLLSLSFHFPLWAYAFYLAREILSIGVGIYLYFRHRLQAMPNYLGKLAVTLSVPLVAWYLAVPYLAMNFKAEHWLLDPRPLSYLWITLLGGSALFFTSTYWNIIFHFPRVSLHKSEKRKRRVRGAGG